MFFLWFSWFFWGGLFGFQKNVGVPWIFWENMRVLVSFLVGFFGVPWFFCFFSIWFFLMVFLVFLGWFVWFSKNVGVPWIFWENMRVYWCFVSFLFVFGSSLVLAFFHMFSSYGFMEFS